MPIRSGSVQWDPTRNAIGIPSSDGGLPPFRRGVGWERLTPDQRLCFNFNAIVPNQFGYNNQRVGRFNLAKEPPMRV